MPAVRWEKDRPLKCISMQQNEWLWMVDDDPIMLFGLQKMLGAEFPEMPAQSFQNGKLALDAFEEAVRQNNPLPRLILLDLNMPIMDGWQFLEAVHQMPLEQSLFIAIVTSSIDPADVTRYEDYKQHSPHRLEYRSKPVKRADLVALVNSL